MKEIPLNLGMVAIVDDADYERATAYKWYAQEAFGNFYAARNARRGIYPAAKLHRFIMDPPIGVFVDHINGNGLDNRRCNLRLCTHKQNMANQKRRANVSGFKGVYFYKARGKWGASICVNSQRTFLGLFETAMDAAAAYDIAAIAAHGEFARLNFPGFANAAVRAKG